MNAPKDSAQLAKKERIFPVLPGKEKTKHPEFPTPTNEARPNKNTTNGQKFRKGKLRAEPPKFLFPNRKKRPKFQSKSLSRMRTKRLLFSISKRIKNLTKKQFHKKKVRYIGIKTDIRFPGRQNKKNNWK